MTKLADLPIGDGLPYWLPATDYLTASETRELPEADLWWMNACPICEQFRALQKCHVARKQIGGRKASGPTVRACYGCHHATDDHAERFCFAIRRRDLAVVRVMRERDKPLRIREKVLVPSARTTAILLGNGWDGQWRMSDDDDSV